jgi:hypothetical protein
MLSWSRICVYHFLIHCNNHSNKVWKKLSFFFISDLTIFAVFNFGNCAIWPAAHRNIYYFPNDISYMNPLKISHRLNRISTKSTTLKLNIVVPKITQISKTIIYSLFICSFLSRTTRPSCFTNFHRNFEQIPSKYFSKNHQ